MLMNTYDFQKLWFELVLVCEADQVNVVWDTKFLEDDWDLFTVGGSGKVELDIGLSCGHDGYWGL
jgi:hypothetical protein